MDGINLENSNNPKVKGLDNNAIDLNPDNYDPILPHHLDNPNNPNPNDSNEFFGIQSLLANPGLEWVCTP